MRFEYEAKKSTHSPSEEVAENQARLTAAIARHNSLPTLNSGPRIQYLAWALSKDWVTETHLSDFVVPILSRKYPPESWRRWKGEFDLVQIALENEKCPPEALHLAATYSERNIRYVALHHPNCPEEDRVYAALLD